MLSPSNGVSETQLRRRVARISRSRNRERPASCIPPRSEQRSHDLKPELGDRLVRRLKPPEQKRVCRRDDRATPSRKADRVSCGARGVGDPHVCVSVRVGHRSNRSARDLGQRGTTVLERARQRCIVERRERMVA